MIIKNPLTILVAGETGGGDISPEMLARLEVAVKKLGVAVGEYVV